MPGQMGDDETGIADRIAGKRGVVPASDGCRQSFSGLSDGKRELHLLLNPSQVSQRISLPQPVTCRSQPGPIGQRHRPPRADPRLAFLPLLPSCPRR